jgi:hypothetical protein
MFLPTDIYTTSGSLKLYHCWTDKVTKFDSSSFYNWEQDNLPVHDLDERTFYLWEQLGYPTSSIPGVALVVSADAPDSAVACNKNIFRTVSAAIEALPQTINFPIIIEVANFGSLGDLVLNNYKFGPRGSLEIINRNFSKQEFSLSSFATIIIDGSYAPQVSANYYTAADNPQGIITSFSLYKNTAYNTLKETSPMQGFLDSSCLSISAAVFSGTRDARLSGVGGLSPTLNGYVSMLKTGTSNFTNYTKSTLIVDSKNNEQPYTSDEYGIAFKPYYFNPDPSDDIYNKDASSIDYLNGNQILLVGNSTLPGVNPFLAANGLYYANKLSKIYINNCDGPIFIRNFFLDGGGSNSTTNQHGVEVNNSPNIYLENMVVSRFRKSGFYFNNSTVNILRSCVANRIYDFDSAGNRLTGNYANRRNFISYNDSSGYLTQDLGAGLLANNSYVNFSSTRNWESAKYSEFISGGGYAATPTAYTVIEFNENANGVILNNSTLTGGDSCNEEGAFTLRVHTQTVFDFNSNVNCGLISNNSKVSLNGRIRLCDNLKGAEINNSILEIEEFECKRNQTAGLELNNSKGIYNKNLLKFHINRTTTTPYYSVAYPYIFDSNGINLSLNSSELKPMMTSSMELRYFTMIFQNSTGYLNSNSISESIKISNNSNLILVSPQLERDVAHSISSKPKKGSEINCTNNSKITLRGTGLNPTLIFGPNQRVYHKNLAALCANENSTIEINGPTKICQFGIDLLGDKNSTINITPSRSQFDNTIDTSSINLSDPTNHTMVELHSTRSCIVVDNQSTLNMKDLGSFRQSWSATTYFDASGPDYGGAADTIYNSNYVSGGSLQFYPNPNSADSDSAVSASGKYNYFTKYNAGYGAIVALNTTNLNFSAATYGGMCVRALNGSIVNVHNVNFPCGWWNASAPYYDQEVTFDSGGACFRPFIWNIADTSQLKASFLSVSGKYPRLAGYVGPDGYWKGTGNAAASGLPAGTPDTSSMSILDLYGANPSGHPFTNVTATNYGPFRLYFGTNPFVNTLVEHGGGNQGIIRQIYSQGYQPSTTLVCSGDVSGLYKMSLQRNSNNNIAPSGFYYGSGVMDTNGHLRVMLDESAAETFANAKHCAAGRSGNAKLVSIYYPYTVVNSGDSRNNKGVVSVNLFDIERDN